MSTMTLGAHKNQSEETRKNTEVTEISSELLVLLLKLRNGLDYSTAVAVFKLP